MVSVPENFALGFVTLENKCEVYYPTTEFYTPGSDRRIRFNDPAFNIEWPVDVEFVSKMDMSHADFDLNTFN